jgi:hypothetical protein
MLATFSPIRCGRESRSSSSENSLGSWRVVVSW